MQWILFYSAIIQDLLKVACAQVVYLLQLIPKNVVVVFIIHDLHPQQV